MFPRKKQPEKKSGVAIMLDVPEPIDKPKSLSRRNDEQERPEDEQEFHDEGGAPRPTPESVNYRTESETCHACEYMQGDQCAFLKIQVSGGDSCNRFEAKSEDERGGVAEHDAGGESFEGDGDR